MLEGPWVPEDLVVGLGLALGSELEEGSLEEVLD